MEISVIGGGHGCYAARRGAEREGAQPSAYGAATPKRSHRFVRTEFGSRTIRASATCQFRWQQAISPRRCAAHNSW